jgi:hypothetical protein
MSGEKVPALTLPSLSRASSLTHTPSPFNSLSPSMPSQPPGSSSSNGTPICSHLLLSEFDILKGSQLRYQYPKATAIKESVLAEAMLPEGAHLRESDWTVFFLPKRQVENGDPQAASTPPHKEKDAPAAATVATTAAAGAATPPSATAPAQLPSSSSSDDDELLCVLNLVRTKYDKTVKRGAIVKALAVVTRYRWYNILKPLLLLALDAYLDCRDDEEEKRFAILANLYATINSVDLSGLTPLTDQEKRVLRAVRLRGTTSGQPSGLLSPSVSEPISARLGSAGGNGPILGPDHIIANIRWNNTPIPLRIPIFLVRAATTPRCTPAVLCSALRCLR